MTGLAFLMRRAADSQFRKFLKHPFVIQLAASKLPQTKFRYYIIQDNLFLEDMVTARNLMLQRAPPRRRSEIARLLKSMNRFELLRRRRAVARTLGIASATMSKSHRSPTTLAYTSFLIRRAATASLGEALAASTACPWTYAEMGAKYAKSPATRHPVYGPWLAIYRSKQMTRWLDELKEIIDTVAGSASQRTRRRMIHDFVTGCRFECMFWDMAYKMERWPF